VFAGYWLVRSYLVAHPQFSFWDLLCCRCCRSGPGDGLPQSDPGTEEERVLERDAAALDAAGDDEDGQALGGGGRASRERGTCSTVVPHRKHGSCYKLNMLGLMGYLEVCT
jgi:hypothetical protein